LIKISDLDREFD